MFKKFIAATVAFMIVIIYVIYPITGIADTPPNHLSAYDKDFDNIKPFRDDLKILSDWDALSDSENFYHPLYYENAGGSSKDAKLTAAKEDYKKHLSYAFPEDDTDFTIRSIISSPSILENRNIDPGETIYCALGIENEYRDTEILTLKEFAQDGGKLILADDFGYGEELAKHYNVRFSRGVFYEPESYDYDFNFTVVKAHLSADIRSDNDLTALNKNLPHNPDGIWDEDNDADGRIDEDPGPYQEWGGGDNDGDFDWHLKHKTGIVGEDEDPLDDDRDGMYNEEELNGIDDDEDGRIDEDIRPYWLIMNKGVGLYANDGWIIAHGSSESYVDNDNNIVSSISEEGIADDISQEGNEIALIVEYPICPHCGSPINVKTGECLNTWEDFTGQSCNRKYNHTDFVDFGRVVFISDPSIFTEDLYLMDHHTTSVGPIAPFSNSEVSGLIQYESRRNQTDFRSKVGLPDDSPEYIITPDGEKRPFLPELLTVPSESGYNDKSNVYREQYDSTDENDIMDKSPNGFQDYDNRRFLISLVYHLLPEGGMMVFDESRHTQENAFMVPVYGSLQTISILTTDTWYAFTISISAFFILGFVMIMTKDKENWVHKYDITRYHRRTGSLPVTLDQQVERVRVAVLAKTRMDRGLSPEEFEQLSDSVVNSMIKDKELLRFVRDTNKQWTEQDLKHISTKLKGSEEGGGASASYADRYQR